MVFDFVSAIGDRAKHVLNEIALEAQEALEKLREECLNEMNDQR